MQSKTTALNTLALSRKDSIIYHMAPGSKGQGQHRNEEHNEKQYCKTKPQKRQGTDTPHFKHKCKKGKASQAQIQHVAERMVDAEAGVGGKREKGTDPLLFIRHLSCILKPYKPVYHPSDLGSRGKA